MTFAYVSCKEYDCILKVHEKYILVKQGGTAEIPSLTKVYFVKDFFIGKNVTKKGALR